MLTFEQQCTEAYLYTSNTQDSDHNYGYWLYNSTVHVKCVCRIAWMKPWFQGLCYLHDTKLLFWFTWPSTLNKID